MVFLTRSRGGDQEAGRMSARVREGILAAAGLAFFFGAGRATLAQQGEQSFKQPPASTPGSLFNASVSQPLGGLFYDVKARAVGDIVTISVVENTQSSIDASSKSARKSDFVFGVPNAAGLGGRYLLPHFPGADPAKLLNGNGDSNFDGQGAVSRKSAFSTTLAARVRQVLPNGDLVVEASKIVEVNREKQTIVLSGIVRTRDISPNNVVLSSDIADLQVYLKGKGFVADANRPGWLFRILQKISPF